MEIIKLKPLSESPLSTQLSNVTGDGWNFADYESVEGPRHDSIITHKKSGQQFLCCSLEEEEEGARLRKERAEEKEKIDKHIASHKYDTHPNIIIDYNNPERWNEGLEHCKKGNVTEMCEDSYWHFLECVPPMDMVGGSYCSGEPYTHNSEGQAVYLCGANKQGKYYAEYGTLSEFNSNKLFKNI